MKKLLSFIAFSLLLSAAKAEDWQTITIGPFGGLYSRGSAATTPANKAENLLNVDITQGGKSVKKRDGYSVAFTLSPSTSPIHNIFNFYNSTGTDVSLIFNEKRINVSFGGAAPSVILSTAVNEAVWDCADFLGYAYCANTGRDQLYKIDGITAGELSVNSKGTMVASCATRLAMAGFSDRPSGIDLSDEGNFSNWTVGSLGSDAAQLTINAPGSRITHITYAFGRLIWFKENSFGYVLIGNQPAQADWLIKTISNSIGTLDNTSTIDPDGNLYFRGQDRRIYKYDGNQAMEFSSDILTETRLSTNSVNEQAYSTYFDNKLWFSVGLSTFNSKIFIHDFLLPGWTVYDLKANGFFVRNNQLYFGSSTGAVVNLYGSGTTDGGHYIRSFWTSKPFFADSPFKSLDLVNVSVLGAIYGTGTSGSTITVTGIGSGYLNSSAVSTIPTVDFYLGASTFSYVGYTRRGNKNYPPIPPLREISVTFGQPSPSATYALPWEVFAVQLGVRTRPWKPEQ